MGRNLVIFGTGALARLLHYYFRIDTDHQVVAFTVTSPPDSASFLGLPVIPFDEVAQAYPPSSHAMFIAVGYTEMNQVRARFYREAKALGYELVSYISSRASCWPDTEFGDNCCVFQGAQLEPYSVIGDDVVLWSGTCVAHDARVGNHAFAAPNAVIAGFAVVGDYCFLGANATVVSGVHLAERCFVGAGALISRDTRPDEVYVMRGTRTPRE